MRRVFVFVAAPRFPRLAEPHGIRPADSNTRCGRHALAARSVPRQFPLPRTTRRALTDSASPSSTFTLSSQEMHASVMLWP